ncbi:hypothetical protein ASF82_12530 [Frigoribacterium sp. Leaf164]|nr:hypothetical protein ASF82_12530 [Frigoribacterium sp. Leaf164]
MVCNVLRDLNPYNPGSGLTPPALEGRGAEIDAFDLLVARSHAGAPGRGMVLHGLRGVGKTVLLNAFARHADAHGWFIVPVEGRATKAGHLAARQKLVRSLGMAARRFAGTASRTQRVVDALRSVTSFSVSFGGAALELGVEPFKGRADSGNIDIDFEELMEDLAPALREQGGVFGVFIDEMQDLDSELLSALLAVQHKAGQESWPFYVVGAGLPSLPSSLSEARSYAERLFDYRHIGALDVVAARAALEVPATRLGASYSEGAVQVLLSASGGYPYFIQTFGKAAWEAGEGRVISVEAAENAVTEGTYSLDVGFFPARWDRATPAERNYLRGMALDGESGSATSEIAGRLGSRPSSLTPARAKLIEKGIIYAPERGRVAFTVPGMAGFIHRQHDIWAEE